MKKFLSKIMSLVIFMNIFGVGLIQTKIAHADTGEDMGASIEAYHGRGYVEGTKTYSLTPGNVHLVVDTPYINLEEAEFKEVTGLKVRITLYDSNGKSYGSVTANAPATYKWKIDKADNYHLKVEILNGKSTYKITGTMHDHAA